MKASIPVYIVTYLREICGKVGYPEIWGVFSRYAAAYEALTEYARTNIGCFDFQSVEDYIEDNFIIEEFFIDDPLKVRGE